jgi:hypothetical protein
MTKQEKTQHALKKDGYAKVRGSFVKTRSDGAYPPSHRDPGGKDDKCQN